MKKNQRTSKKHLDLCFDSRFLSEPAIKEHFTKWIIMTLTNDDLRLILKAAEQLKIPGYCTMPAVDVMFEIACSLCVLETEIVTPDLLMDKIKEYLNGSS